MRSEPYRDELHTFRGDTEQRRHRRNGGSSCAMDERRCGHDMMMNNKNVLFNEVSRKLGDHRYILPVYITLGKKVKVCFYIAQYSLSHKALHTLPPGRPAHSDTNSTSLGSIQPHRNYA